MVLSQNNRQSTIKPNVSLNLLEDETALVYRLQSATELAGKAGFLAISD